MQLNRKHWISLAIVIGLLWAGWHFLLKPDPRTAFLNEVKQMIASVNQGDYGKVREFLSPAFVDMLSSEGWTVQRAILTARKMDQDGGHLYRFVNNPIFQHRDYAEVEVERSGRGGDFSTAERFWLPYVWIEGEWRIAGDFRGQRTWNDPF